jgi:hypothetical protein
MLLPASIKLDGDALTALGLEGISQQHAELAQTAVLSKAVCPCEAAHILAGFPIISHSDTVTFLNTRPPDWRRLRVHTLRNGFKVAGACKTPEYVYLNRPPGTLFGDMTFTTYFENYEVGGGGRYCSPWGALQMLRVC